MASPHAAGVAALIVSRFGYRDPYHRGLTLNPGATTAILYRTATKTACPTPRTYTYVRHVPDPEAPGGTRTVTSTATCEGPTAKNGFYGRGIVSASRVARSNER
jgi:hypothetical protein